MARTGHVLIGYTHDSSFVLDQHAGLDL